MSPFRAFFHMAVFLNSFAANFSVHSFARDFFVRSFVGAFL